MASTKDNIIAQLRKDILPLQGFRATANTFCPDVELGPIKESFPNARFPLGVIHEFCCTGIEDAAASSGFIAGILSALMQNGGVCLWISASRNVFPMGLKAFGIDPDKIIFVDLQKEKDILWTMEEVLKCDGLSAVLGEMREFSFTASRRFQLAADQSGVRKREIADENGHGKTNPSQYTCSGKLVPVCPLRQVCLPEADHEPTSQADAKWLTNKQGEHNA